MIGGFLAFGRVNLGEAFVSGGLGNALVPFPTTPIGAPFKLRVVTPVRRLLRVASSPRRFLRIVRIQ
jgi:hypothetical protein